MIEIKNLVHTYQEVDEAGQMIGEFNAVNNTSLDIHEGEFLVVLGHNGSGKSTLARHINGILMPTEGDVIVDGINTKDKNGIWDIRQKVAMVFQNPDNQMVATIIEEEVGFGPENLCLPSDEIHRRVDESLSALGMIEYKRSSPTRLSGGQKQKIVIAGALAMEPKYIVLDEPTAMLEPRGREEVIGILENICKKRKTGVILITHFMDEAVHADRVAVMSEGMIRMEGTPKKIFSDVNALRNLRMDVPPITQIAEGLRLKGLDIPRGILSREELVQELCRLG